MEIWMDGSLDAFTPFSGLINKTTYNLAFGQHLPGLNGYNFNGSLDAVTIFDYAMTAEQILDHMEHSLGVTSAPENLSAGKEMKVFPNPVNGPTINIHFQHSQPGPISLALYDITGKQLVLKREFSSKTAETEFTIPVGMLENGIYLLSVTLNEITENELIVISK